MKKPLLIAAVCAGLPGYAAQDAAANAGPGTAPAATRCNVHDNVHDKVHDNSPPASSALPARASTRPEPHLGTVAPNTRLPSHVVTPSMRAMERATAAQAADNAGSDKKVAGSEKNMSAACQPAPGHPAPKGSGGHD